LINNNVDVSSYEEETNYQSYISGLDLLNAAKGQQFNKGLECAAKMMTLKQI
jgi:hypothetical protein